MSGALTQSCQLAVVLLCRTATHVPDHWRNQTPLGRDFSSVPRHRLLAFLAGARKTKAGKIRQSLSKLALSPGERESTPELAVLELEIPETVTPSLSGEGPQSPVGPLRVVVEVKREVF